MDFQYISIFIFIYLSILISICLNQTFAGHATISISISIYLHMLQDMLRYNMERTAGQALDTLGDSRRVRELLSVHNIGQRLFAKWDFFTDEWWQFQPQRIVNNFKINEFSTRYVLGLSQGTVSELLSKPKSWDKLTEKGRDSYRKMHAWCHDDQVDNQIEIHDDMM